MIPTTDDTAVQLAILPDWSVPIRQSTVYRTDITRSRVGLEQRSQRRRRPNLTMEYQRTQNDQEAQRSIETEAIRSRRPILTPWWTSGVELQTDMLIETAALLSTDPIDEDWNTQNLIYLWSRALGGEFRTLVSRDGRSLVLSDEGTHGLYRAGDFAFPVRRAIRSADDNLLESRRHRTNQNRVLIQSI